jgi:hypothetical protein
MCCGRGRTASQSGLCLPRVLHAPRATCRGAVLGHDRVIASCSPIPTTTRADALSRISSAISAGSALHSERLRVDDNGTPPAKGRSMVGQGLADSPDRLRVGFRVPTQSLHLGDDAVDLVERRLLLDRGDLRGQLAELV